MSRVPVGRPQENIIETTPLTPSTSSQIPVRIRALAQTFIHAIEWPRNVWKGAFVLE